MRHRAEAFLDGGWNTRVPCRPPTWGYGVPRLWRCGECRSSVTQSRHTLTHQHRGPHAHTQRQRHIDWSHSSQSTIAASSAPPSVRPEGACTVPCVSHHAHLADGPCISARRGWRPPAGPAGNPASRLRQPDRHVQQRTSHHRSTFTRLTSLPPRPFPLSSSLPPSPSPLSSFLPSSPSPTHLTSPRQRSLYLLADPAS